MTELESTQQPTRSYLQNSTLIGIVIAVVYGLTLRLSFETHWTNSGIWVMTSAFLFGGPLVIGLVTVNGASKSLKKRYGSGSSGHGSQRASSALSPFSFALRERSASSWACR